MTDLRSELAWLVEDYINLSDVVENDRGWPGSYEKNKAAQERAKAILSMTEWQFIETAPKDGTPVILGYYRRNLDGSIYQEGGPPIIASWIERIRGKSGWATSDKELNSEGPFSPTHWKPLPEWPNEVRE